MRPLLLDTHVALWWLTAHPRLDAAARTLITESECHLSAVSVWEVAIKFKLGKLPVAPEALLSVAREAHIGLLSITPEHTVATTALPKLHGDPFDRLLIAQARHERLQLLTADRLLCEYGSDILNV
jgi:PIN domain nuclease of toxin-antitoxin system